MFKNFQRNYSHENRKAVIASPILAKAALRNDRGGTKIVVVFKLSTRQEFYWVFRARTPRSARRSWRFDLHHPRDLAGGMHYRDFPSFVAYLARLEKMEVVSVRIPHKRKLSALMNKTEHESIFGNWQPQDTAKITTDMVRRRSERARSRRWAW